MYKIIFFFFVVGILFPANFSYASRSLLFFEAQGVGGYSSEEKNLYWYSMNQEDTMQKPSLGFDYIQKISSDTGDVATIMLQCRVAYDNTYEYYIEPQLYNAYLKLKAPVFDLWAGHNRPALGLSSYLDSHGLLLPTLAMKGYGYDRDWGAGIYREFSLSDVQVSITTGSGMPVYFKGNYLISGRLSFGILSQDNYNVGFSGAFGETLETMGYHLISEHPMELRLAGIDTNYIWDNFEVKLEAMAGRLMDENAYALFGRFGINLMEENRLKLEFQPVLTSMGEVEDYELSGGLSFIATGDVTFRGMYQYEHNMDDHRVIFQVYYYSKVI